MPKGILKINGYDAFETWGMSCDTKSLSALLTPAGMKENVKSTSRLQHGTRIDRNLPKMASRTVNLTLVMTAPNEETWLERYSSFCEQLATGFLDIEVTYIPNVIFHFEYNSCTQFTQFVRQMASYSLKLTEYDPSNRT